MPLRYRRRTERQIRSTPSAVMPTSRGSHSPCGLTRGDGVQVAGDADAPERVGHERQSREGRAGNAKRRPHPGASVSAAGRLDRWDRMANGGASVWVGRGCTWCAGPSRLGCLPDVLEAGVDIVQLRAKRGHGRSSAGGRRGVPALRRRRGRAVRAQRPARPDGERRRRRRAPGPGRHGGGSGADGGRRRAPDRPVHARAGAAGRGRGRRLRRRWARCTPHRPSPGGRRSAWSRSGTRPSTHGFRGSRSGDWTRGTWGTRSRRERSAWWWCGRSPRPRTRLRLRARCAPRSTGGRPTVGTA